MPRTRERVALILWVVLSAGLGPNALKFDWETEVRVQPSPKPEGGHELRADDPVGNVTAAGVLGSKPESRAGWDPRRWFPDEDGDGVDDRFWRRASGRGGRLDGSGTLSREGGSGFVGSVRSAGTGPPRSPVDVVLHVKWADGWPEDLSTLRFLGGRVVATLDPLFEGVGGRVHARVPRWFVPWLPRALHSVAFVEAPSPVVPQLAHATRQVGALPRAWLDLGFEGDPWATLAVVDGSGVDESHPALAGKVIYWKDFAGGSPSPSDPLNHGTKVAAAAVGAGFNSTDSSGRIVATGHEPFDGSGYGLVAGGAYSLSFASFNVTRPGPLEVKFSWVNGTGSTAGVANFSLSFANGTSRFTSAPVQGANYTIVATVLAKDLGVASLQANFVAWAPDDPSFNVSYEVHYPFDFTGYEDYPFRGVAPRSQLVALRATNSVEVEEALDWLRDNAALFNVTVACFSFKFQDPVPGVLAKTNELVRAGVVVVAAGGNDGPGQNYAGHPSQAPAAADLAISVGATAWNDSVSSFSSQGGPSPSGATTKPDLVAPGGEFPRNQSDFVPLVLPDSNDGDADGSSVDWRLDDVTFAAGTSYSAPLVAGAAMLVVQAMGGAAAWTYDEARALSVKNLLLATATETAPARRAGTDDPDDWPTLDRGEKDPHEGYGRLNVDAALEAVVNEIPGEGTFHANLSASGWGDSRAKHCWAARITLNRSYQYDFVLDPPDLADFDLYLFEEAGDSLGEPVLVAKGARAGLEVIERVTNLTVATTGTRLLVVKATVEGAGEFSLNVTRRLDSTPPSVVRLMSPGEGALLSGPQLVQFEVRDDQTTISAVELWQVVPGGGAALLNATSFGEGQGAPGELVSGSLWWDTAAGASGWRDLHVRALDGNHNGANSTAVGVLVDNDPPELLELEVSPDLPVVHGIVRITARFRDATSNVTRVTVDDSASDGPLYFFDVNPPGSVDSLAFAWWTGEEDDGSHNLKLVAEDAAGNVGASEPKFLVVDNRGFRVQLYWTSGVAVVLLGVIVFVLLDKQVAELSLSAAELVTRAFEEFAVDERPSLKRLVADVLRGLRDGALARARQRGTGPGDGDARGDDGTDLEGEDAAGLEGEGA
ncbi:MAG: hypothetical protein Kow0069_38880 [Promethearchaeota archaeon]